MENKHWGTSAWHTFWRNTWRTAINANSSNQNTKRDVHGAVQQRGEFFRYTECQWGFPVYLEGQRDGFTKAVMVNMQKPTERRDIPTRTNNTEWGRVLSVSHPKWPRRGSKTWTDCKLSQYKIPVNFFLKEDACNQREKHYEDTKAFPMRP